VVVADVDGDGDLVSGSSLDDAIAWRENLNNSDPLDPDSDDDGLLDGFEINFGFNPYDDDGDKNGTLDGQDDDDLDGLVNVDEQFHGTDPGIADTDGDGFDDEAEVLAGTNPLDEFDFPAPPPVPLTSPWAKGLLLALLVIARIRRLSCPVAA